MRPAYTIPFIVMAVIVSGCGGESQNDDIGDNHVLKTQVDAYNKAKNVEQTIQTNINETHRQIEAQQ